MTRRLRGGYEPTGDEEGRFPTVKPASRLGVEQGAELRAVDDLERWAAGRSAESPTPINPTTRGRIAAAIRIFRGNQVEECLVLARADHIGAYERLPVEEQRERLTVVTSR